MICWGKSIFGAVALLASLLSSQGARLGIVRSDADTVAAADLLTAALTKKAHIQLVERAEIERVAKERSLTLGGGAEAGKILGADGLIFLDSTGTGANKTATVRLVGVRQGVILYSASLHWPPQAMEEWVETIAGKLAQAGAKSAVQADAAIKLSLLNLRSAINAPAQQLLERELTAALLVRLAQEPQIFILERRQLGAAVFEKELAASAEKFWTGSHLLDGTINRDGFDPKRVTIAARLRAPDGKETTFEIASPRDQLGRAVDELAGKILSTLKVEGRSGWDAGREAVQHLAEANWAVRWKMWKEAQAAADSAWALGAQDLSAATTRLLAYGRDDLPHTDSWHLEADKRLRWPSNPPPPEAVESPFQALALIQEMLARNPYAVTNQEWWSAARESIHRAGQVLDYFYWSAEARQPVEAKLADLRSLGRDIFKTLMSHPELRKDYWLAPDDHRSPDEFENNFGRGQDIFSIYLRHAAHFSEKPEDTAAVIRELMKGDPYPYIRPELLKADRMISPLGGWKWADRKREWTVWNQLAVELMQSTDVTAQLEGRLMKWAAMPNDESHDPEDALSAQAKTEIGEFIEENKETLLKAKSKRRLLLFDSSSRLESAVDGQAMIELDDQFTRALNQRREANKASSELVELKRRIAEKAPFDFQYFARLISLKSDTNTAAQLMTAVAEYRTEVIEKFEQPKKTQALSFLPHVEKQLAMKAGLAPPAPRIPATPSTNRVNPLPNTDTFNRGRPPFGPRGGPMGRFAESNLPPIETVVAPEVLKTDRFWAAPINARAFSPMAPAPTPPLARDGKLWLRFDERGGDPTETSQFRFKLVVIDPTTWQNVEVPLTGPAFIPQTPRDLAFKRSPRALEILNGTVFTIGEDGLMRKPNGDNRWASLPLPSPNIQLWRVSTNLYLLSPESLHQVNLTDGSATILASVRRRPALNPLDEEESLQKAGLMEGPNGALRLLVRQVCFSFAGAKWKHEFALTNADWTVSGEAAFAVARAPYRATELHALQPNDSAPRLIAKAMSSQPGAMMPLTETNWNFSTLTMLAGKPFLFGTNVAVILARGKAWTMRMDMQQEPSRYDLFVFGHPGSKPVQVQIEVDISKIPGSTTNQIHRMEFSPWALCLRDDLLFGNNSLHGFWRLPRAEIQNAIEAALKQTSAAAKP